MAEHFTFLLKQSRVYSLTLNASRDLYVQALASLQAVDESDDLSYFSIMGECLPQAVLASAWDECHLGRVYESVLTRFDIRNTWPTISAMGWCRSGPGWQRSVWHVPP